MVILRYNPVQVFSRGRDRIAHIRDEWAGRDRYLYSPEGPYTYLHWDRLDAPVRQRSVRDLAREMLTESGAVA